MSYKKTKHLQDSLYELRVMSYQEYLKTPEWNERRKRALKLADYRCRICNKGSTPLHVHHRSYKNLGNEPDSDLIAICESCHNLFHKKRKLKIGQPLRALRTNQRSLGTNPRAIGTNPRTLAAGILALTRLQKRRLRPGK